jgi:hypothetical protein
MEISKTKKKYFFLGLLGAFIETGDASYVLK